MELSTELQRRCSFYAKLRRRQPFLRNCSDEGFVYEIAAAIEFTTELQRRRNSMRNSSDGGIFEGITATTEFDANLRLNFMRTCGDDRISNGIAVTIAC